MADIWQKLADWKRREYPHRNKDSTRESERARSVELGFTYYFIGDLERAGLCKAAVSVVDIPEEPHWQILYRDKDEKSHVWRIWVFHDEQDWLQTMQFYFEDAANMQSPTNTGYNSHPMNIVGLDCSGKVQPAVQVTLVSAPRKGKV